ncbi:MAG: DUF3048 domain-containing protein [Candidatus Blackburnbacteria bacterium]|nr:DUF3048 domain-containing protein [Candidatus Blackburnbacteria bacterium]
MSNLNIKLRVIGGLLGIFLLSVGISYAAFSYLSKMGVGKTVSPQGMGGARNKIDLSLPKTEECPLNGQMFTKAEREIWEKRRPLGVMIENHTEARPQSGLSSADVVYEAVAEGAITRFLVVFYCGASAEEVMIGPVRSARTYYLDWVSEYGQAPLYAHVGGANRSGPADALGQIEKYGWYLYNDLNQFSIGLDAFRKEMERLPDVATEHQMYATTDKLWTVAAERGLTYKDKNGVAWNKGFVQWKFADGQPSASPPTTRISFPFWEGYMQYAVLWTYDQSTNTYKRENGGGSHKDLNNDTQIYASNVVVMFTTMKYLNDPEKHLLYTTTGSGKALFFQNGNVTEGKWSKKSRTDRTIFTDKAGKEILFVRGPIWIEVLETGSKVTY